MWSFSKILLGLLAFRVFKVILYSSSTTTWLKNIWLLYLSVIRYLIHLFLIFRKINLSLSMLLNVFILYFWLHLSWSWYVITTNHVVLRKLILVFTKYLSTFLYNSLIRFRPYCYWCLFFKVVIVFLIIKSVCIWINLLRCPEFTVCNFKFMFYILL